MISIIDEAIYNVIIQLFSVPTTFIMTFISHLGSATVLILLCILFLSVLKDKKIALAISINLILVYLLNVLLKTVVARPRPEVLKLVYETGFSFPSGHAMVATGFYGFLIYLAYKKIDNKKIKNSIIAIMLVLILFIGLSRIYLGAHYATDIIGGFIIGTIYLMLFIKSIKGVKLWEKSLQ